MHQSRIWWDPPAQPWPKIHLCDLSNELLLLILEFLDGYPVADSYLNFALAFPHIMQLVRAPLLEIVHLDESLIFLTGESLGFFHDYPVFVKDVRAINAYLRPEDTRRFHPPPNSEMNKFCSLAKRTGLISDATKAFFDRLKDGEEVAKVALLMAIAKNAIVFQLRICHEEEINLISIAEALLPAIGILRHQKRVMRGLAVDLTDDGQVSPGLQKAVPQLISAICTLPSIKTLEFHRINEEDSHRGLWLWMAPAQPAEVGELIIEACEFRPTFLGKVLRLVFGLTSFDCTFDAETGGRAIEFSPIGFRMLKNALAPHYGTLANLRLECTDHEDWSPLPCATIGSLECFRNLKRLEISPLVLWGFGLDDEEGFDIAIRHALQPYDTLSKKGLEESIGLDPRNNAPFNVPLRDMLPHNLHSLVITNIDWDTSEKLLVFARTLAVITPRPFPHLRHFVCLDSGLFVSRSDQEPDALTEAERVDFLESLGSVGIDVLVEDLQANRDRVGRAIPRISKTDQYGYEYQDHGQDEGVDARLSCLGICFL
ncbi:hypothetical protein BDV96DRAFT_14100 [Lophiotrema nucula]|uniref:Uncharacterized protein n=1 Tax=Lophiotrema nucula TaxID=690887 RepID=A0A6A5ZTN4_9PLEO|nr:hypothetical protein BDV96DRAFT_14100 [Lophiotrema nucula]